MTALAFDTHAFVKRLTMAGMPEVQAEILADEQTKLIDEKLATKLDVAALRSDIELVRRDMKTDLAETARGLKTDIELLRRDAKADLAETKADLIKWMFGTIGFQTLLILGAVIALARVVHP
jgi:hypothetical protein